MNNKAKKVIVKLKDVAKYRKQFIQIEDDKHYKRCRVRLHRRGVRLRDEVFGSEIKTKKQRLCKKYDFIVAEMDAKFGGYGIVPKELENAIVSSHYYLYEINIKKLSHQFLNAIIDSGILQEQIKAVGSTNYSRVSAKEVLEYEIPCPSLEKQKQIISQYVISKDNLTRLKTEITHQQAFLKKLRQQILQEAIEGKLTADWRGQNPAAQPASELLKRIQAEKARLIEAKKIKAQNPLPPISKQEQPFKLPKSWAWCRVGDIIKIIYGSSLKKSQCIDNASYPVFGSNGIVGYYDKYLTKQRAIIIGRKGSAGALNISQVPSWTTDVAYYVEEDNHLNFEFIFLLLKSLRLEKFGKGIKPGINRNEAYKILLPLPPLAEQKAIVSKVEKLLRLCDQLEAEIKQNQIHAEGLMQAVLTEAFR